MNWRETVAIFGGTFDPPHVGHRLAVEGLFRAPGVGRVIVMPAGVPPLKAGFTPSSHRLTMARTNFSGLADVTVDDREVRKAERTGTPGYTCDTVQELRGELKDLAWVIGTDQLAGFHRWHRFPELLELCHWIVLERKPDGREVAAKVLAQWEASGLLRRGPGSAQTSSQWRMAGGRTWLCTVPTDAPALKSTEIRQEIARSGRPANGTLTREVEYYLKQNGLYGTEKA